jgi:molybdopterin-guanine dinucleotide biosynthesis protein A
MTSIVLAGGKGERLGRDKTLEKVGRHTLIQRIMDCLVLICDEIVVVIAPGQPEPSLSIEARVVVDLYPGRGALGGIYTGLVASDSFYNLVVACDMPFLNPSLLRYLIQVSPGFDVIIPRDREGKLEPLHALYSKNCLAPINKQIQQGELKLDGFLGQVKVRYVDETETDEFDPKHLSFFNINTPADLRRARAIVEDLETP